jgi:hypothetical protein
MKLWIRKDLQIIVAGLAFASIFVTAIVADEMAMPVKNLRLPMEYYESGAIKTQLKAGFALVPPKGMIVASNVVMEMFFEDGSTNVLMTAENCEYDREKQTAGSKDKIKIIRDNVVLTGKGFEWYSERERVKILSDAKIVLTREAGTSTDSLIKEFRRSHKKDE